MAHVKNAEGGPGDEDPRPPPHLPADVKGKAKKITSKKRKYADTDTTRAATVAAAVEHAERGGARSGVQIVDQLSPARTVMLEGRRVALEETQP